MATRNRIIYQSEALFVGPSPATGSFFSSGNSGVNQITQLHRIQDASYDFSVTRQDVNQYGQLSAIDRVILEPPTVNLSFSYLTTDGTNEKRLGLYVSGDNTCIKDIINKTQDEKNYFIATSNEGIDALNDGTINRGVIAVSNGFISNYQHNASVGQFPTSQVQIEGLNMAFYTKPSGVSPAVNPADGQQITSYNFQIPTAASGVAGQPTALRPGDIRLTLANAGLGVLIDNANVQSYTFTVPLTREPVNKLGTRFAASKEIRFPITTTMSVEGQITDMTSGSLADILCNDRSYDLSIDLYNPACSGLGTKAMTYQLKGAKLDSQSFSSSIGANKSVTLQFSSQIGGSGDLTRGVFLSGSTLV